MRQLLWVVVSFPDASTCAICDEAGNAGGSLCRVQTRRLKGTVVLLRAMTCLSFAMERAPRAGRSTLGALPAQRLGASSAALRVLPSIGLLSSNRVCGDGRSVVLDMCNGDDTECAESASRLQDVHLYADAFAFNAHTGLSISPTGQASL